VSCAGFRAPMSSFPIKHLCTWVFGSKRERIVAGLGL
jgi:hypothetical protein